MPGAPKLRVLIVDDEPDNGLILGERLKQCPGWEPSVATASSGLAALDALREELYDILFVDYRLPDTDGLKLLEQVRQLHPKVAVVMVSAWGSEKTAVEAMRLGAIDYMTREDLEQTDLARLLRRALEMQDLQSENAELRQVNRMKDEFISSVSHELRTPLAVILGYAKTMEDGELGALTPEQQKAASAIRRRGESLLDMLNRLLSFKESHRRMQQAVLRPTDLLPLVRETLEGEQPQLKPRGIVIEPPERAEPLWALADPPRLRDAVRSLLSNAAKFSPDGSRIRVAVEERGGREAWVRIRDQGRGIPPEALPRLFEGFFHADKDLTREVSGLGLGLALARQIIELHGGRVWLESEGPGRGSTATIALPLAEPESPRIVVEKQPRHDKKRVLVVEDNEDIVQIVRLFLAGFSENLLLTTADRGQEALDLIGQSSYDLLILDLMMPGVSGFEVLDRLLRIPEDKRPRVLILSGHQEAARQAVKRGATDYMLKPFAREAFLQKVLTLLGIDRRGKQR